MTLYLCQCQLSTVLSSDLTSLLGDMLVALLQSIESGLFWLAGILPRD